MKNTYYYLILTLLAFLETVFITKSLIPKLRNIAKQPIYDEGPNWHLKKSGTPTMGGIGFIIPFCIIIALLSILNLINENRGTGVALLITLLFCLLNGLIGIADDITKLKRSKNGGLTPKQKLFFQGLIAAGFLFARFAFLGDGTELYFGNFVIDLKWFYYPLAMIFLLGIINCANLTDGVDGLASSTMFAISVVTFFISLTRSEDALTISSITIGIVLGFLIFNINPAKIFMGDTGSLFLGAVAASYAFSLRSLPAFILICGVYVVEGISVMLQVLVYKITKKRIFKMAPLHHHLERCGFDECKICLWAILVTFSLSTIASLLIGG